MGVAVIVPHVFRGRWRSSCRSTCVCRWRGLVLLGRWGWVCSSALCPSPLVRGGRLCRRSSPRLCRWGVGGSFVGGGSLSPPLSSLPLPSPPLHGNHGRARTWFAVVCRVLCKWGILLPTC